MRGNRTVGFFAGALRLEGRYTPPQPIQGEAAPGFVLCHPHPLYGGTLDHPVLVAAEKAFADRGYAVLRFNFRGAGASEGRHGEDGGEVEDVRAALDFLAAMEGVRGRRLGVLGYSFGAAVGLEVGCADSRVRALVAVAPPLVGWPMEFCAACPKPKQVWVGDRDEYCPPRLFEAWWRTVSSPKSLEVLEGADHLLAGREKQVATAAACFAEKAFGAS